MTNVMFKMLDKENIIYRMKSDKNTAAGIITTVRDMGKTLM
jgi:hypothetical protein